jgi:hypothetical protein
MKPLISTVKIKNKCVICGVKNERYTCCVVSCGACVCRDCVDNNTNGITYVHDQTILDPNSLPSDEVNNQDADEIDVDHADNINDESIDENNLIEPYQLQFNDEEMDGDLLHNTGDPNSIYLSEEIDDLIPRDNFHDGYLVDPGEPHFDDGINEENEIHNNIIPNTNAGMQPIEVHQNVSPSGAFRDMVVSGHILLNQCGTLLTRSKHQIRGSSKHKFFYNGLFLHILENLYHCYFQRL